MSHNDRRTFNRAVEQLETWRNQGAYSLPAEMGAVAVICSDVAMSRHYDLSEEAQQQERQSFVREADQLAGLYRAIGKPTELIIGATSKDMRDVLQDDKISSIVTIGHGTFGSFQIPNGIRQSYDEMGNELTAVNYVYTWANVATDSTHIKTGPFVQRHCGVYGLTAPIPLGTFAVDRPSHVHAAAGRVFNPINLGDPVNLLIKPLQDLPYDYDTFTRNYRRKSKKNPGVDARVL